MTDTRRTSQLTDRQAEVLEFIALRIKSGVPPSVEEIGRHFGFNRNAARDHLHALKEKGRVRLIPRISRGIVLVEQAVPQENREWQPMETSPRDGTPLLLFAGLYRDDREFAPTINVGWFNQDHGWIASSYSCQGIARLKPKAWMHLPPFPKEVGATHEIV